MTARRLNNRQEEELVRLISFEREKCTVDGNQAYHCAFPLRREDRNQNELIKLGMLAVKRNPQTKRPFVVVTPLGYAFVEEREQALAEIKSLQRRDTRLVLVSGAFACLSTVIGFIVGRLV